MNAFTPAIRASLLSDATKGASLRRWSIRDLLNFHPTTTTTTTSDDGGSDHHAAAAAGVESLLREVQIRLAMQHSKLSSFSTSMNEGGVWYGSSASGGSSGTTTTTATRRRRRRRSGGDDDGYDYEDEDADEAERRARARACLGSLMQLHENTYLLPHRIVDGDWRGLLGNFDKKPNRKYVSGVFDEIMSRHGSSVETFADAVIHARNGAGMMEEGRMRCDDDDVPGEELRPRSSTTTRGGGYGSSSSGEEEVPEFLRNESIESFLHSRLMIQLLCDHYISLGRGKVTGAISLGADVAGVIVDAATEARHVCDANLGIAPEFRIIVRPPEKEDDDDDGAMMVVVAGRRDDDDSHPPPPPIIRSWLHHAIVEVVKNAMTSNVQRHYITRRSEEEGSTPPAVDISFGIMETKTTTGDDGRSSTDNSSSSRYLKIRITDRGIGLEDKEQAFGFARSSSRKRWDRLEEQQSYAAVRQPLGSLGVGLPLSRLMMRAFGGDLDISNNDIGEEGEGGIGGGCTATLTISYDDTHIAKN
jgi:pyruvate dehydrogenase kinase 2/3/4